MPVNNPHISCWITASAGTGKTKTLVDRIMGLLLHGVKPAKILCITFTKAAAIEMRVRIHEEVVKQAMLGQSYAAACLDTLPNLQVMTIHSFCQNLLKRHPKEAGLSTNFDVVDTNQTNIVAKNIARDLFANTKLDKQLKLVVEYLTRYITKNRMDDLITLAVNDHNKFDELTKVEQIYSKLGIDSSYDHSDNDQKFCSHDNAELVKTLSLVRETKPKYISILSWLTSDMPNKLATLSSYTELFLTKEGQPLKSLGPALLKQEQERVIAYLENKKTINLARFTEAITYVIDKILAIYAKYKKTEGLVDYHDLILKANKLLEDNWIAYQIHESTEHVLVDEAQDTSPDQWVLIMRICSEFFTGNNEVPRSLFVVGDAKQSIFSFQGADVRLYNAIYEQLCKTTDNIRKLSLDTSYRSARYVLSFVDQLFNQENIKQAVCGHKDVINHGLFRKEAVGSVSLWPLIPVDVIRAAVNKDKEEDGWRLPTTYVPEIDGNKILAELIASKIAGWLTRGAQLKEKGRALRAGDIIILVRRRTSLCPYLISALQKHAIKVAGLDRLSLKDHIAIMDLLALAKFILLPHDDLNLAIVLRSPIIGVSEEELYDLTHMRGSHSLWHNLSDKPQYTDIYTYLVDILAKSSSLSPLALYCHVLHNMDCRAKLVRRLGIEVNDPIDEFLNILFIYEKQAVPSLQGFVQYFLDSETEIKRDAEHVGDAVRIMTVHGAKGLQAPVVFLADTTKLPKSSEDYVWLDDSQSLPLFIPNAAAQNHLTKNLCDLKYEREYSEYLRLLYVALTRAEDHIIICGSKGRESLSEKSWYGLAKKTITQMPGCNTSDILIPDETPFSNIVRDCIEQQYTIGDIILEPKHYLSTQCEDKIYETPAPAFISVSPAKLEYVKRASVTITAAKSGTTEQIFVLSKGSKSKERGVIIHELMHILPEVAKSDRAHIADNFMLRYKQVLSGKAITSIVKECLAIFAEQDIGYLFGPGSLGEVPIVGTLHIDGEQRFISARIDRLIYQGDRIIILDYKSDARPPENQHDIPEKYITQLVMYKRLLSSIYASDKIDIAILWTTNAKLIILEEVDVGETISA